MRGREGRLTFAAVCGAVAVVAACAATQAVALDACPDAPQPRVLASGQGTLESVGVDRKGRIFFTDLDGPGRLLRLRNDGRVRTLASGIDAPGGIVFKRNSLLVGYGNSFEQAADGPLDPEGGLLQVDPRTGATSKFVEGLQMANGVARGAHGQIFASNALGTGIDRISGGTVELGWANVTSPNGLAVSTDKKYLYASQTLTAAAIQRIPLNDPAAASTWYSAPAADAGAGLDGLERGPDGAFYVAAAGGGQVWRVTGPGEACVMLTRTPFPTGPSDLAFTRGRGFRDGTLLVTTWGGELLALPGAA
ncbi:MAG: SMP-30/gluconolactonase/LRE family protein [Solirubrobacterales bacterium]|nr:SMP-30/gluconolactonase/LRE family protein [Thermoleophilales bacterium]MCO5326734.1 SMP-30/gluconolactonase/LRE family protein [Solirubrobacterales bacterium]